MPAWQWMTAASGIVHDEGKDHPGGPLHGFQMCVPSAFSAGVRSTALATAQHLALQPSFLLTSRAATRFQRSSDGFRLTLR